MPFQLIGHGSSIALLLAIVLFDFAIILLYLIDTDKAPDFVYNKETFRTGLAGKYLTRGKICFTVKWRMYGIFLSYRKEIK